MKEIRVGISLPIRELTDDLGAITEFALTAEDLGFTHLRIPDQVIRPKGAYAHEPLMLLAYIAAMTKRIELVPSVIVAPARQTVLLAKQVAELDVPGKPGATQRILGRKLASQSWGRDKPNGRSAFRAGVKKASRIYA